MLSSSDEDVPSELVVHLVSVECRGWEDGRITRLSENQAHYSSILV